MGDGQTRTSSAVVAAALEFPSTLGFKRLRAIAEREVRVSTSRHLALDSHRGQFRVLFPEPIMTRARRHTSPFQKPCSPSSCLIYQIRKIKLLIELNKNSKLLL
jgi:hypothetical protein